jgi:hypothetical protein
MDFFTSQTFEIVINVVNAICLLFCFSKMGISPWAAIIPIYGTWCLYDRVWGSGWYMLLAIAAAFVFPPIVFLINGITYWKMFSGFGKGTLFCLFGLIFQPVAIAICAFDGSTYCG